MAITIVRSRWRLLARDRGDATVEVVIVASVLILLPLLVFQTAAWAHSHHVAQTMAERAVEAARAESAGTAEGARAAHEAATGLGSTTLESASVDIDTTTETVTVTVTGTAPSVIPGWSPHVSATQTGPIERFIPD